MENKKSYYAIIPANVRYDEDLCPNAKLLYGEITALCNEKGFCWATNDYFAKLYKVSKVSISNWIAQLKKKCYITSEMEYKEGSKEILNRYIRIFGDPPQEIFNTPIKKNFKENITLVNITSNNYAELAKFFHEGYMRLNSGHKMDFAGKEGKSLKSLNEKYPQDEIIRRGNILAEIESANNPYQKWKFLPSILLAKWNEITDSNSIREAPSQKQNPELFRSRNAFQESLSPEQLEVLYKSKQKELEKMKQRGLAAPDQKLIGGPK